MLSNRRDLIAGSLAASVLGRSAQAADGLPGGSPPPPLKGLVRKGYANTTTHGQMHYRYVNPPGASRLPPLIFFHPNPFSSLYYAYALEEMGRDRLAIAFDTPGYGESEAPAGPASIEQYARAMAEALETLGYGAKGRGKVDISGFHTGSFIAAELAASRADLVRRVVMSAVPFWQGKLHEDYRRAMVDDPVTEDSTYVVDTWTMWVKNRPPLMPLARGFELFAQSMLPGSLEARALAAVLAYDAQPQFQKIQQPVLLINPGGEQQPTRDVLPFLSQGRIVEVPQLPHQIYDLAVAAVGILYRAFLDRPE